MISLFFAARTNKLDARREVSGSPGHQAGQAGEMPALPGSLLIPLQLFLQLLRPEAQPEREIAVSSQGRNPAPWNFRPIIDAA